MKHILILILFIFSKQLFAEEVKQEISLSDLLLEADNTKNTAPTQFNIHLDTLNTSEARLGHSERELLKLLNVYRTIFKGNYSNAEGELKSLIKSTNVDLIKFRAIYTLVNVLNAQKKWENGLKYLALLDSLSEAITSAEHIQNALITSITLHNELKQYDVVLAQVKKLESHKLNDKNRCLSKQISLDAFSKNKDSNLFDIQIDEALGACISARISIAANIVRTFKANRLIQTKEPKKAISLLIPHVEEVENTKYPMLISEFNNILTLAYIEIENIKLAELYLNEATHYLNDNSSKQAIETHRLTYLLHELKGDTQQAFEAYKTYTASDRAHLDEVSAKALAYQLAKHQSIQQQNEIRLLNNQNELLNNKNELLKIERSLTQSEAENTRLVVTLLSAIVALLAFFGYRSWQSQRRLKVLAEYDHLTKINNRGHFMALAEETLLLAERAHQTASCIILDLDKFKSINDTYGHAAGDWALKAVVEAVKPCIRDHDIFARLGGEEFVILLPSCDIQAATFVTEKCLEVIEAIDTADSGNEFKITASFGITTTRTSGYQVTSLINDADKALYQSKENGRNQMTIFTNEDD